VFGWQISRWEGATIDDRLITTGPNDQVGINGALTPRRGEIDSQAVIAYVNTIEVTTSPRHSAGSPTAAAR
jgi:hypothetical protein